MTTPLLRVILLGDAGLCKEFEEVFVGRLEIVPANGAEGTPATIGLELSVGPCRTKEENLRTLDRAIASPGLLLSNVVACTLAEQSRWVSTPGRLFGIGLLPSLLGAPLVECVKSDRTDIALLESFQRFMTEIGRTATFVGDVPGLVLPRIRSMIVNEAFFALGESVATSSDIDLAMRLGTRYPSGPFAWGEAVGLQNVLSILVSLQNFYGEERYRPAPLLRRSALDVRCR